MTGNEFMQEALSFLQLIPEIIGKAFQAIDPYSWGETDIVYIIFACFLYYMGFKIFIIFYAKIIDKIIDIIERL